MNRLLDGQINLPKFEEANAGLFSWDVTHNIIYADRAVAECFGLPYTEAKLGLPLEAYIDRIDQSERDEIISALAESVTSPGQRYFNYSTQRPDGSKVSLLAIGQCFHSDEGVPIQYSGIVVPLAENDVLGTSVLSRLLAAYEAVQRIRCDEAVAKIVDAINIVLELQAKSPSRH